MNYAVTEYDKELVRQPASGYRVRVSIVKDGALLGVLDNLCTLGSYTVDADSDIRRTASLDIRPSDFYGDVETVIESFLPLSFRFEIGISDIRTGDYRYYPAGTLILTGAGTSYDASTDLLSFELSDSFSALDGTRNGQIGGSPTITIPQETDGVKHTLRSAMSGVICDNAGIRDTILEDVGEYYGMPENNSDYEAYRELNPDWNVLPYDLEFNAGDVLSSMVTKIRDIYPNCQAYFDAYGHFCYNMIPSDSHSPIVLDDSYLQSILVAQGTENVDYDVSLIKNVTEVFGQTYEVERFCENCTVSGDTYLLTLSDYTAYSTYKNISFTVPSDNGASPHININGLGKIPLYYEYTTNFVAASVLLQGEVHVFRIMKKEKNFLAYYLGQFQPHGLCVLTGDAADPLYTRAYFAEKYNCSDKNVAFSQAPDSPFSIQKLGEILDCKNGGDYDNILSDSVAVENAKYENYKTACWNDTVTITTKLLPWIDVNTKVSYRKQQESEAYIYLVKSISHDFAGRTTALTLNRFADLYQEKP